MLDLIGPEVELIYLFGSRATGKTWKESDYDVAVLLSENLPRKDYFEKKLDLIGVFMKVFETNDVDIVLLNEAGIILKFQVLKYGARLFEQDPLKRVRFEFRVIQEHADFVITLRVNNKYLHKYIRERKYGDRSRRHRRTARKDS